MIILKKDPNRDFRIINLTDPQLSDGEWEEGKQEKNVLERTVKTLVERTCPDLITVSGDIAYSENEIAYRKFAELLDGFDIPWAPVFGNHDIQGGLEPLEKAAKIMTARGKCLFEEGDRSLGFGNYTIVIEQNGKPLHGLLMMDSHDRRDYTGKDGKTGLAWSDVLPEQIIWYRGQVKALSEAGIKESTLIIHIPLYTYREAAKEAFKEGLDQRSIEPFDGMQKGCFNEGYEDSFGVMYEEICSYPEDNGFFDAIKDCGHTKTVLCGHDHVNSFAVTYRGVRLIYSLKTGPGCYWDPRLNGGTLLKIDKSGKLSAEHVFAFYRDF